MRSILKNSNVTVASSGEDIPKLVIKDDEKVDNLVAKEDAKADHDEPMDFAGKFKEEIKVNFRRMDSEKQVDDADVSMVDENPQDSELRDKERKCLKDYEEAAYDLELFLKQKSKVEWLRAGDSNTTFFHKALKRKMHKNMVDRFIDNEGNVHNGDNEGNVHNGDNVHKALKRKMHKNMVLVDHYSKFLGINA
ncbi:hypothetical protein QVD17_39761 [Tagetes erecta]|uniref:RNA-directed DNA polymerase, eukaryota, reverse transcriptase zinc-binding domain protein n=1 Tax=Tagetes erecta TaxID=13708 RepID=A0AAD8JP45_TARER|nr:hypothetical protein QVD17_39761 [Tagetes erecta]